MLRKAMSRFISYYDRPGHYLRVSVLFRKPFWRDRISGSWFMLDAFGGCCVYDEGTRHDAGEFGVLSWLIAGTDALSMSGFDDDALACTVMASLPVPLGDEAARLFVEAKIQRWPASVSAQPGGLPVLSARAAHQPEPQQHAALFMVGDYLFDSTINGTLDSADFATDLLSEWILDGRPDGTAQSAVYAGASGS
jgi:monoamine oxidase